jgi:vacuolar-type H+-ATPase subunit C/Vma6
MNKADVGKVLAVAMAIDARLGAADETAFRAKVEGWSLALSESMDFDFARDAVGKHYKSATETLMPAHLNAMWTAHRSRQHEIDNVRAIGSSPKSQGMPDDVRAKLVEMGLKRP